MEQVRDVVSCSDLHSVGLSARDNNREYLRTRIYINTGHTSRMDKNSPVVSIKAMILVVINAMILLYLLMSY